MRANFYVDGYNFYSGLCEAGLHGFIWIHLQGLCEHMIRENDTLGRIRYFTCLPHYDTRKLRDHKIYISALEAVCPAVEVFYGDFAKVGPAITCKNKDCGNIFDPPVAQCPVCQWKKRPTTHIEKQTDVSLAVNLVKDAFDDDFDVAYIVSGDTDLIPAIEMVRQLDDTKKVGVLFPPAREHEGFRGVARFAIPIRAHEIKKHQLDDPVQSSHGDIKKPDTWRP